MNISLIIILSRLIQAFNTYYVFPQGLSALTSRLSADFADFKLLGNEVLLRAADVATGAVWYLIEGHYVTEGLEGCVKLVI